MSRSGDETRGFRPLAAYELPSSPVAHLAQRLLARVRRALSRGEERAVEDDRLKQASQATIDDHTAFPDCSQLARELDATLGDWASAEGGRHDRLRLVVIPPGDTSALLETWAGRNGHAVLEAPAFGTLVTARAVPPPDMAGDGVLVVPRLEHWFVRHRHGLARLRTLLATLSSGERRCVVGCNSWAWAYLCRVAEADLLLPEPLIFAPFDAGRLERWFRKLAEEEGTRDVVFRESGSGTDVFSRDDGGEFASDFLPSLAARSRGIPWVAWGLWQRSLRTRRVDGDDGDDGDENGTPADGTLPDGVSRDESTFWLVDPDEFVLPGGRERAAALVLHALLLHGRLGVDELALVLPIVGESNLVPALVRAGFVERMNDDRYRCAPGAYPTIVERLDTDGFPVPSV